MKARLVTKNLELVLDGPEETLAWLDSLGPEEMKEVSPVWLARARETRSPDPWVHGFRMARRDTGGRVGQCGFKGPPDEDGAVEIAYGVADEHQGKGYATEAAEALARFAFDSGRVTVVRAHTLKNDSASARVLTKCRFRCVGEVVDPEDGLVWRWELRPESGSRGQDGRATLDCSNTFTNARESHL